MQPVNPARSAYSLPSAAASARPLHLRGGWPLNDEDRRYYYQQLDEAIYGLNQTRYRLETARDQIFRNTGDAYWPLTLMNQSTKQLDDLNYELRRTVRDYESNVWY